MTSPKEPLANGDRPAAAAAADPPPASAHARTGAEAIAGKLVALLAPTTFYDAGCGTGDLVRAMLDRGVDAHGGDLSAQAIGAGGPAGRVAVKDLTEPLDGRYDLISCVDVLAYLPAPAADLVIDNLCAATDRLLVSATPTDLSAPSLVTVRAQPEWAQDFAVRGFFRRTDIDASFAAPWAVLYQRAPVTPAGLVGGYESMLAPLRTEVAANRQALADARRDLAEAGSPADRLSRWAMADDLIGARAELALVKVQAENSVVEAGREAVRLRELLTVTQRELASARAAAADADRLAQEVRASTTWRIGRALMAPVRLSRLPVRLGRRVARVARRILTR